MRHSTPKATKAQQERFVLLKELGCLACRKIGVEVHCGVVEIHHLNVDGKAGQRRRGHDFTIPLGKWHHQGVIRNGWIGRTMLAVYGPSLAKEPRGFRSVFGTDDELLAEANQLIGYGVAA